MPIKAHLGGFGRGLRSGIITSAPLPLGASVLFTALLSGNCVFEYSETQLGPKTQPVPVILEVLHGYPEITIPADNPTTEQGVELGRRLFYDTRLSADNTQSCATCHVQANAFSEPKRFSLGIHGQPGDKNASQIVNAAWHTRNFWDGRVGPLEEQALQPVVNPLEMAFTWTGVAERLNHHPQYPQWFREAFGTHIVDSTLVVKALAQFQRTLISQNSKFDRVRRGEAEYTKDEGDGFRLFFTERGDCFHCHLAHTFTDFDFRNNGLDSLIESGSGLGGITGKLSDDGKWKTPTLRNVEFTAPYMHDGRFQTLEEVLEHYNTGVLASRTVDPLVTKRLRGEIRHIMTEDEKRKIIAFLKTLSDSSFITNPAFSDPWK